MLDKIPMKGTLLNAVLIALGALIGLSAGRFFSPEIKQLVIPVLGLCNVLFAVKMFFKGDDILITVGAVVIGGIVGSLLKLDVGLDMFAEWARTMVGGSGRFNEGLITTSVLYCVGPVTLMGCMNDGLTGDLELLKLKSVLDGTSAVFFAAALGSGVLVTAGVVLLFQGALTLGARFMAPLAKVPGAVDEMSAVGGVMLLAIGLGLADIKHFPVAVLLPALAIAPLAVMIKRKIVARSSGEQIST